MLAVMPRMRDGRIKAVMGFGTGYGSLFDGVINFEMVVYDETML